MPRPKWMDAPIVREATRQAGLTVRYGVEGLADTAGIVADPIGLTLSKTTGTPYEPIGQYTRRGLSQLGLPEPSGPVERVVGDASRAVAGGGGIIHGAQHYGLSQMAKVLADKPVSQLASAAAGAAASGTTREAGGGAGLQMVADIAAGAANPRAAKSSISPDRTTAAPMQIGEAQRNAFELGRKLREMAGGGDLHWTFYESLPKSTLDRISRFGPITNAFFESGARGAQMPRAAKGTRRGAPPEGGVSRNHVEQKDEIGVSMSSAEGVDYRWHPMGGLAKVKESPYEGFLLDPEFFYGSDGEPLMVGLKPLVDN